MIDTQALVETLDFQLDIQSDNESLLYDATLDARRVYNETIRLAKEGVDWDAIPDRVADDANLVKNTTQRVVAKALGAMENYYEYDDFGLPSHTTDGAYPLRTNYEEGYNLSLTDDGDVAFRISAKPYRHIEGVTSTSTFSRPHSKAMSGSLGRQKPCFTTTTPNCTSPSPTPSNPFETSMTHGRSLVWT
jgi:hypothetical protein